MKKTKHRLKKHDAMSNGTRKYLNKVDGRSAWARRLRYLEQLFTKEFQGRHKRDPKLGELVTISTMCSAAVELERIKSEQAEGRVVNTNELVRLAGLYTRSRKILKLAARGRRASETDDGPTLEEFLEGYR